MDETETIIGAGHAPVKYAAIFVFGTLVGTAIRIGLRLLPSSIVDPVVSGLGSESDS